VRPTSAKSLRSQSRWLAFETFVSIRRFPSVSRPEKCAPFSSDLRRDGSSLLPGRSISYSLSDFCLPERLHAFSDFSSARSTPLPLEKRSAICFPFKCWLHLLHFPPLVESRLQPTQFLPTPVPPFFPIALDGHFKQNCSLSQFSWHPSLSLQVISESSDCFRLVSSLQQYRHSRAE